MKFILKLFALILFSSLSNLAHAQITALGTCGNVSAANENTYNILVSGLTASSTYDIDFDGDGTPDETGVTGVTTITSTNSLNFVDGTMSQTVSVNDGTTNTEIIVHEVLCVDADDDGDLDFSSGCDEDLMGSGVGYIVATAAPYNGDNVYVYVLTNTTDNALGANTTGLFTNLVNGGNGSPTDYKVYAFNFSNASEAATFIGTLMFGETGTVVDRATDPAGCVMMCGSESYDIECRIDDVAIQKTIANAGPYNVGDIAEFSITVFNQGTDPIFDVIVSDYIPAGLTFDPAINTMALIPANPADWIVAGANASLEIPTIAVGGMATITIFLEVNETAIAGGSIVNNAEVTQALQTDDGISIIDEDDEISNTGGGDEIDNEVDDNSTGGMDDTGDVDDFDFASITICTPPTLAIVQPDAVCDGTSIDLTTIDLGETPEGGTSSFYATAIDAEEEMNPLASNVVNTTQDVFVRYELADGCFTTGTLNIVIEMNPTVDIEQPAIVCAPNTIDLSAIPINGMPPGGSSTFHPSMAEAEAATNALTNTVLSNSMDVYLRYELPTGCFITAVINAIINPLPTISEQPVDFFSCDFEDAFFSVTVDEANVSYQWELSTDGGNNFFPVVGETGNTLSLPVVAGNHGNQYRVLITRNNVPDPDCELYSEVVNLFVQDDVSLACRGQVNVTLDANCEATITSSLMLSGPNEYEFFTVDVMDADGNSIPNPVGIEYVGMTLMVSVTDLCSGLSCWGNVTLEDKIGPTIVCEDYTLACTDDTAPVYATPDVTVPAAYAPEAFDNCSEVTLTFVETVAEGTCDDTFDSIITRVWTATDATGRTDVCTQTINVERGIITDVIPPSNFNDIEESSLLCDERETASTNSCGAIIGWNAIEAGEYANDLYVGHPSPNDEFYSCGSIKWKGTGYPTGSATCSSVHTTFQDQRINVCESGASEGCFKIIRTWFLVDKCSGAIEELEQIIKVSDDQGPVISDLADAVISTDPWTCAATYIVPNPWIEDNCSDLTDWRILPSTGSVSFNSTLQQYVVSDLPIGIHTITYEAYDCCGNTGSFIVNLTVEDQVPPVVVCESFHTVSLNIDGFGQALATTFNDGSHDNCSDVTFRVRRMNDTNCGSDIFGDTIRFCCADIGTPVMVELEVSDAAGNLNYCMVETTVEDKLAPQIKCPSDLTISCDYWFDINDLSEFGQIVELPNQPDSIIIYDRVCQGHPLFDAANPAQVYRLSIGIDGFTTDNCGVTVSEQVIDNRACGQGTITRIFTATDPDGRTASCSQRITTLDCDPFYINDVACTNVDSNDGVKWPCDFESSTCGPDTDPDQTGRPIIFNEDNCSLVSVDYDDEEFTVQEDACFKIQRTWIITDYCNFDETDSDNNDVFDATDDGIVEGKWTYIQYIKVLNSSNPIFFICEDVTLCGENDDCTGSVELPMSLMDDCTPNSDLVVDFKIDLDSDGVYDLLGANVNPYPYPNPNNLPVALLSNDNINANGTYPVGTHRILWNAEDHCGNVGSCSHEFDIRDCKEPTPYCDNGLVIPVMPATGEIEVLASAFNEGAFDNCTENGNLQFRIEAGRPGGATDLPSTSSIIFTCEDLRNEGPVFNVNVFVIDEAGNYNYCSTTVEIQDPNGACLVPQAPDAMVYGNIETEELTAVEEVEVRLTGGLLETEFTSEEGLFEFPELPVDQNYDIEPRLNTDPLNGISTFDLVLISKHILNIERLDSPYKMIAADVNKSGSISTLDMIALRKMILFIDTEFPNNESWRFVDRSFEFPDPNNPFLTSFPEMVSINGLTEDYESNFVGVKVGDVNNSAVSNSIMSAQPRNFMETISLMVEEQRLEADKEFEIAFRTRDFKETSGFQFTLSLDEKALEIVDVIPAAEWQMSSANFGLSHSDKGLITVSWNTKEAMSIDENAVLFKFKVKSKSNGLLSSYLNLNSALTKKEAYNQTLELLDINLEFEKEAAEHAFTLYQNLPNPFKDETMIAFNLPTSTKASLKIFDVSGKVLKVIEREFNAGYNEVNITRSDLKNTGILYYQLDTPEHTATKKMILIE